MKHFKILIFMFILSNTSCKDENQSNIKMEKKDLMIRMAEIEIDSVYIDEYIAILKQESEASIRLEPGVISIFPMFQKEQPNQIRLLEIYANRDAYESHLKTPHFLEYKNSTLHMVKELRLIDMTAIDPESISQVFLKIND